MASYFVLGSDNREYGPVTLDVLRQWFSEGRLVADSQLREENSQTWKSAREFPEVAAFVLPKFTPAIQSIPRPPSPPSPSATVTATVEPESLPDRDYQVEIGEWIGRAWQFYKANWGEVMGFSLLVFLLQIAAGFIPCVGGLAAFFVDPMLTVGLYYYLIRKWRGASTDLTDLFAGFKFFYVNSLVGMLLLFLICLAVLLPVGALAVVLVVLPHADPTQLSASIIAMFVVLGLITFCLLVYIGVSFKFWYALIADHGVGGWDALRLSYKMVSKHWFAVFAYLFVTGLIMLAGVFACVIGLLFTIPLGFCCYVVAYDAIFGPRESATQPG